MIDDNTLKKLNTIGTGLNVDLIESYVNTYNIAVPIASGCIEVYASDATELSEILKELKPSSPAIIQNGSSSLIRNTDLYSLSAGSGEPARLIYGPADIDIQTQERDKLYITDSYKYTLCGMEIHDGINVVCIYKFGKVSKIYAVSERGVYYNFTNELMHSLPEELSDLENIPTAELHGVAYQSSSDTIFHNVILDTVYDITHNKNIESIQIIFDNIFMLTDSNEIIADNSVSDKFSKLEFMDSMGLSVVKAGILRGIYKQSFNQAVQYLSKFFRDKGIYRFSLSDNNDYNTLDKMLVYDSKHVSSDYAFEGIVNGIEQFGDYTKLIIVNKACNDNLVVSEIQLNDLYIIEKNNIHIGSKIEFRVINDRVELIQN